MNRMYAVTAAPIWKIKSVQTCTITAAPWREIYSPGADSDQMHDVLVIQRCQRFSCFIEADLRMTKSVFMRLIMLYIYVQHSGTLCSAVLLSPCWLLHIQPSTFCLLSSSVSSRHSPPVSPSFWKVWFIVLGGVFAKNGHNRTSVITSDIYISSSIFLFLSLSVCSWWQTEH